MISINLANDVNGSSFGAPILPQKAGQLVLCTDTDLFHVYLLFPSVEPVAQPDQTCRPISEAGLAGLAADADSCSQQKEDEGGRGHGVSALYCTHYSTARGTNC